MLSISRTPDGTRAELIAGGLLLAALAWTFWLYAPGLSGIFLFDDFPNLGALDRVKSNPNADEIIQFFLHGIASPTGRPLSLATFALQANDWPGNPAGFIRINLLLHVLNGALLCWWLLRLGRLMPSLAAAAPWIAVAATSLWLTAPIQVTGVLYIVQRMVELSATFVFLGMLLYLVGRGQLLAGSVRRGLATMTLGVAASALGVLAKENAALFPMLVLATEATVLAGLPRPAAWRRWALVFLVLPTVALLAYLPIRTYLSMGVYDIREFTLVERVLTESRVLVMYLYKILLPWPSAVRLIYDDFPVSSGLFQPWTTFVSVIAILGALAFSWVARLRYPLLAFGVLWFFCSHLLESTILPLELVFEHRNYQSSAGVWFAVVAGAWGLWPLLHTRRIRVLFTSAAVAYALLLSAVTWQITTLWGNPMLMADWWSQKLPDSKRAKIEFLGALLGFGLPEHTVEVARQASEKWPDDPSFYLVQLHVSCHHPKITAPIPEIMKRLQTTRTEIYTAIHLIDQATTLLELGQCKGPNATDIRRLAEAALDNPAMASQRRNLLLVLARTLKLEGRVPEALQVFSEAVEMHPLMVLAIQGFLDELNAERFDRAYGYLQMAESDTRITPLDRWTYRKELEAMQRLWASYAESPTSP